MLLTVSHIRKYFVWKDSLFSILNERNYIPVDIRSVSGAVLAETINQPTFNRDFKMYSRKSYSPKLNNMRLIELNYEPDILYKTVLDKVKNIELSTGKWERLL